jgi:UDP-N-acetylmuramoylalanine--D-glutamate ligase
MVIPWELRGMRVLVVGAARTGRAVARFLCKSGAKVWVVEKEPEEKFPGVRGELESLGAKVEFGPHREEPFLWAQGIVVSPGVPPHMELLAMASLKGVSVVGELELASWFFSKPIVAITGTNGKTTTTTLVGLALEAWGKRVFVGGNIGNPFIQALELDWEPDVAVLEVSSFQLETTYLFRPKVAGLLNLTQDHLDWHPSMDHYRRSKAKIFSRQGPGDVAVVNRDDPEALALVPDNASMEVLLFSLEDKKASAWAEGQIVRWRAGDTIQTLDLNHSVLSGPHGLQNCMAAALCSSSMGCPPWAMERALREFRGLEHRTESVGEVMGVRFVNDSKATNVGAVIPAIMGCEGGVVWIGGGKYKSIDFSPLREPLRKKAKAAVLLGEAAPYLERALRGILPLHVVRDLEEAVPLAFSLASPGDTVLFSPACSSFDQYRNYEERGRHFKELVGKLARGQYPKGK